MRRADRRRAPGQNTCAKGSVPRCGRQRGPCGGARGQLAGVRLAGALRAAGLVAGFAVAGLVAAGLVPAGLVAGFAAAVAGFGAAGFAARLAAGAGVPSPVIDWTGFTTRSCTVATSTSAASTTLATRGSLLTLSKRNSARSLTWWV